MKTKNLLIENPMCEFSPHINKMAEVEIRFGLSSLDSAITNCPSTQYSGTKTHIWILSTLYMLDIVERDNFWNQTLFYTWILTFYVNFDIHILTFQYLFQMTLGHFAASVLTSHRWRRPPLQPLTGCNQVLNGKHLTILIYHILWDFVLSNT